MTEVVGRRTAVGVAMGLAAPLLFSVNATVAKVVMANGLSSLELVSLRSAGAALVLVTATLLTRPAALRTTPRELGFLVVYGVMGIAMVQWLYFVAIRRMPVGIALLLEYTAPIMVALYVRFGRGEDVRRRVWLALGLSLGGLALVAQVWDGLTLDGIGVLAALGAAVSLGTYYVLGEHGLGRRDPLSLAAYIFTVSAVLWAVVTPWWSFPFDALTGSAQVAVGGLSGSVPTWVLALWVVVLGTVAPFGLILLAVGRVGPARVGMLGMIEPVAAALVAWLVLDERLAAVQLLGGGIVLVGIVLAETSRTPAREAEPLPEGVAA